MRYYTGIGSRKSPPEAINLMTQIAKFLCHKGFILRSGGAAGADMAFEAGVLDSTLKEIYLPWKNFNLNPSTRYTITEEAYTLAQEYHPAWDLLSRGAKDLIARDGYQILGPDLRTPSAFLVCWTPGGRLVGGTAQALRIAEAHTIPCFNIAKDKDLQHIHECMQTDQIFA